MLYKCFRSKNRRLNCGFCIYCKVKLQQLDNITPNHKVSCVEILHNVISKTIRPKLAEKPFEQQDQNNRITYDFEKLETHDKQTEEWKCTLVLDGNKYWSAVACGKRNAKEQSAKATLYGMYPAVIKGDDGKEEEHNEDKDTEDIGDSVNEDNLNVLDMEVDESAMNGENKDDSEKADDKKLSLEEMQSIVKRALYYHEVDNLNANEINLDEYSVDELKATAARHALSIEGTKPELLERVHHAVNQRSVNVPVFHRNVIKTIYSLATSLRKVTVNHFEQEMFQNEGFLDWLKETKSFTYKHAQDGEGVAEMRFSTIDQSDAALEDLKANGMNVEHPPFLFRDKPWINENVPSDRPYCTSTREDLDKCRLRMVVLEEISSEMNCEEKLMAFFPDVLTVTCFNSQPAGFVLLELKSIEAVEIFLTEHGPQMKLDDEKVRVFKYAEREKVWETHVNAEYKAEKETIKQGLTNEERVAMNIELQEIKTEMEEMSNNMKHFGQEKIKQYLLLKKKISPLTSTLHQDVYLRKKKGELVLPEGTNLEEQIQKKKLNHKDKRLLRRAQEGPREMPMPEFAIIQLKEMDKEHFNSMKSLEALINKIKHMCHNLDNDGKMARMDADVDIIIAENTPNYMTKLMSKRYLLVNKGELNQKHATILNKCELPFKRPILTSETFKDEDIVEEEIPRKVPKCPFFKPGKVCEKGDRCDLAHGKPLLIKYIWKEKVKIAESPVAPYVSSPDDYEIRPKNKIPCFRYQEYRECNVKGCKYLHVLQPYHKGSEDPSALVITTTPEKVEDSAVGSSVKVDPFACKWFLKGTCHAGDKCQFVHQKVPVASADVEIGKIQKDESHNLQSETDVCVFHMKGHCEAGAKCPYIHSDNLKGAVGSTRTKMPCKHYQFGHCKKGDACNFSHDEATKAIKETRVCRHFQNGTCTLGETCRFAHVLSDSKDSHPKADSKIEDGSKLCRFYMNGQCHRGKECIFRHARDSRFEGGIDTNDPSKKFIPTRPCRHYELGQCYKGQDCTFLHIEGDMNKGRAPPPHRPGRSTRDDVYEREIYIPNKDKRDDEHEINSLTRRLQEKMENIERLEQMTTHKLQMQDHLLDAAVRGAANLANLTGEYTSPYDQLSNSSIGVSDQHIGGIKRPISPELMSRSSVGRSVSDTDYRLRDMRERDDYRDRDLKRPRESDGSYYAAPPHSRDSRERSRETSDFRYTTSGFDELAYARSNARTPPPASSIGRESRGSSKDDHFTRPSYPPARDRSPLLDNPPMARGRSAMARGRSPMARGRSPMSRSRSPMARGRSPMARGRSPMARGRSPMARGRSPMARSRSPMARSRSPMTRGRSPMARGRSPMARGRSPLARGRSPMERGRSPMARSRSPMKTPLLNYPPSSSSPNRRPRDGSRREDTYARPSYSPPRDRPRQESRDSSRENIEGSRYARPSYEPQINKLPDTQSSGRGREESRNDRIPGLDIVEPRSSRTDLGGFRREKNYRSRPTGQDETMDMLIQSYSQDSSP